MLLYSSKKPKKLTSVLILFYNFEGSQRLSINYQVYFQNKILQKFRECSGQ